MKTTPVALAAATLLVATALLMAPAWAKLPPPSDEAKAKAAENAAKAAWGGKVESYKLCKSMDATAAHYYAQAKQAGKEVKPPMTTAPCADPGPFVYTPPAAAPAATAAAPPAVAAAPAKK